MMEQDTVLRDAAVPMYAAVHILGNPFCIDGAYHYFIPHFMVPSVRRGAFVSVPFGQGNRKQLGVVVSVVGVPISSSGSASGRIVNSFTEPSNVIFKIVILLPVTDTEAIALSFA